MKNSIETIQQNSETDSNTWEDILINISTLKQDIQVGERFQYANNIDDHMLQISEMQYIPSMNSNHSNISEIDINHEEQQESQLTVYLKNKYRKK